MNCTNSTLSVSCGVLHRMGLEGEKHYFMFHMTVKLQSRIMRHEMIFTSILISSQQLLEIPLNALMRCDDMSRQVGKTS